MKKSVLRSILFLLLITESCCDSLYEPKAPDSANIVAELYALDFLECKTTKSDISMDGSVSWSEGDVAGLFSNSIGKINQNPSQISLNLSTGKKTSVAYSIANGWKLIDGGDYNYISYYPYSKNNGRERIDISYLNQVQIQNNSTVGLNVYDYMYSDPSIPVSQTEVSFSLHHIGALVNLHIIVPEDFENITFYKLRLSADTQAFTYSASYSIDSILSEGKPEFETKTSDFMVLSFGESGIKPMEGSIDTWMMMFPTEWKGKTISVKLYAGDNNIPTLESSFIAKEDIASGVKYSYSIQAIQSKQIIPDKPELGDSYHILLFGHSFGLDCTEHLPAITKAAGITDVHYGRYYHSGASLSIHWGHIKEKDAYTYYDSNPSKGSWEESTQRRVDDILAQYPWDIILFQQGIGFGGEGKYSSYQPHLNYLTQYVTDYCENIHGKTPVIGWNMFWGYNDGYYTDYDRGEKGALSMYNAIVQATKDMMEDDTKATEIKLIVTPGTAIQNARGTTLNDPGSSENPSTTKLLTRDGYHASYGIGRYTAACTWFQYLIAPIYGVSIEGNTYRPTSKSFDKDLVTDERAALCWKCAIEAVKHPFEVTHIEE